MTNNKLPFDAVVDIPAMLEDLADYLRQERAQVVLEGATPARYKRLCEIDREIENCSGWLQVNNNQTI